MSATESTDRAGRSAPPAGARAVALPAIFTALAVALGFLLAPVPNVELVTLTVFASGVALGRLRGGLVGAVAMAIYSGLSPNGSALAIPPLYVGQIAGMAAAGIAGGAAALFWRTASRRRPALNAGAGLLAGLLLTGLYQCLVILGLAVAMPEFNEGLMAAVVANAFFSTIHLVSNAVIFAVMGPVLLPRVAGLGRTGGRVPSSGGDTGGDATGDGDTGGGAAGDGATGGGVPKGGAAGTGSRGATALLVLCALALAFAPLRASGADDSGPDGSTRDGTHPAHAVSDTSDAGVWPGPVAEPADDVRAFRPTGVAGALARLPSFRATGPAYAGHRASIARGALPATLTPLRLHGRSFTEWATGGLALTTCVPDPNGPTYVPGGFDVSLLRAHGPSIEARPAGAGHVPLEIEQSRRPMPRPYGRLTMTSGDLGLRGTAAEFGRQYGDAAYGLGAFLELREGRTPAPNGAYELEAGGGILALDLPGDWFVETTAIRTRLDRAVPEPGETSSGLHAKRVLSSIEVVAGDGRSFVSIFHDGAWTEVAGGGSGLRTVALSRDGAACRLELDGGPVDGIHAVVATREAEGSALAERDRSIEIESAVDRRLVGPNGWRIDLSAGWRHLGDDGVPVASVTLSRPGGDDDDAPPRLYADLSLLGRHATGVERLLESSATVGAAAGPPGSRPPAAGAVAGNDAVEPERALSLSGGWSGRLLGADAGARAEVARLMDPMCLEIGEDTVARPGNGSSETATALSVWVAAADTARAGAGLSADVTSFEPEGCVLAREPVALVSFAARAWFEHRLFRGGYLDVRWDIEAGYEAGRDRGPWEGLVEESALTLSARVGAHAGAARAFVLVEDVLDAAPPRVPGLPAPGRTLSAGFSWTFWD